MAALCSCSKEENNKEPEEKIRQEYRIAVVLPEDEARDNNWHKSIEWALENLNKALVPQRQIKVTAEWFDENTPDKEKLFKTLAQREDICAVIGPLYSKNAAVAARQCFLTDKMLIPATVSSETLMRKYASSKGFLWCLTENDISQCEILLTRALQKGAKTVSLLTSNDEYGTTFLDWFAFQANELGLETHSIEQYDEQNLSEKMNRLLNEDTDCLICIPRTKEITIQMNECRRKRTQPGPFLLFSDVAYITPKDATFEGMEGITSTYNPQSGFPLTYEDRFGEAPGYGNAHFFDAVTLAGLAVMHSDLHATTDLNESLREIVSGNEKEINICTEAGLNRAIQNLIAGEHPHITGASGNLYFDSTVYTNVLHSLFCHWQVYEGKHLILEYNTSDASNRTDPAMANWNWKVTQMQNFDKSDQLPFPPKEELYAMIIATSTGWSNYRHQANAYAMYHLLRKNGVDDDHILLITQDDVAWDPQNPTFGFIQSPFGKENLRNGVDVDYHMTEVPFGNLIDLFIHENPYFRPGGANDNLFVYWAGHGEPEGPRWLNDVIPAADVAAFFHQLSQHNLYRKMFVAMETCYAGQVGRACEDRRIPGMVCLTAANENETSKASRIDESGQVWLSNSFTDNLLRQLMAGGKEYTLYDLYAKVYNSTIGSHVSVYNEEYLGANMHTQEIKEFIYP